MKHTKQRILSLVDKSTGEVANGIVELTIAKSYLPKFFAVFVKHQKDIHKLNSTTGFYFELCGLMRKGNVLIMSIREIAETLKIASSTVYWHMQKLAKLDFIVSKGSYHIINPKYVLNGGRAYYVQAFNEYAVLKMEKKCPRS